jgi:hypothetical protein
MFYLLGGTLSFAVLFLMIAFGTLFNLAVFRLVCSKLRRIDPSKLPGLLLLIHLAPFLVAFGVVLGFVLPAFLKLEPPSTREGLSPVLMVAAALGVGILATILVRLLHVLLVTWRQQSRWMEEAEPLPANDKRAPVFVLLAPAPLMAVTGLLRPRIFVSQQTLSALTQLELAAALAHEFAHVRSRDNLKQLLLRITRLPRWSGTSPQLNSWIGASEVLADRTAIASGTSPYHLASALVKVAQLSAGTAPLPAIAASHLVPDCKDSAVASRVLQLREILDEPASNIATPALTRSVIAMRWLLAGSVAALYLLSLNSLLPRVHEALEWLVR